MLTELQENPRQISADSKNGKDLDPGGGYTPEVKTGGDLDPGGGSDHYFVKGIHSLAFGWQKKLLEFFVPSPEELQ